MSMSARYHATEWAKGKTPEEILAEITRLENEPRWQGAEFDDARVNHMTQTRIDTLRALLPAKRTEEPFLEESTPSQRDEDEAEKFGASCGSDAFTEEDV